jgi:hypothetical protein
MRHLFALALVFSLSTPAYAEEPADAAPVAEAPAEESAAADKSDGKAEVAEEVVPESYDEAAESVSLLVKSVQDKNWSLALGLILTLVVFLANKVGLKDKVGSKAVPWVATGLAMAATCGIGLSSGVALADAAVQGLLAGVVAIGGWEMLFKHLLKAKSA